MDNYIILMVFFVVIYFIGFFHGAFAATHKTSK
jgi:hypothetical protein